MTSTYGLNVLMHRMSYLGKPGGCRAAGLDPVPIPYALRHSFAPLLLAEGKQPTYVSRQLGHSIAGLSLGDRSCLALGRRLGTPALTADQPWQGIDPPVEVRSIREHKP